MNKKTAAIFIAIGIVSFACAIAVLFYNYKEDKCAKNISDNIVFKIKNQMSGDKDKKDEAIIIGNDKYAGYIIIEKLNLQLPVMSNWNYEKLKNTPCIYYGSAEHKNLIIAAHNYKAHFGRIWELEEGDSIVFVNGDDAQYHYMVKDIEKISGEDATKIINDKYNLTLFTCDYSGKNRIVVRGIEREE